MADASERDLRQASDDPGFQYVSKLLVTLPLQARAPSVLEFIKGLGLSDKNLTSVTGLLAGLNSAIDAQAYELGSASCVEHRWAPVLIEQWRKHYDTKRPHIALGYRPPAPETIVQMDQRPVMHQQSNWATQVGARHCSLRGDAPIRFQTDPS